MKKLFLFLIILGLLSCEESADANDAYNSGGAFAASDINGTWRESNSGLTIVISGVSNSMMGTGKVTSSGSLGWPSAAVGGNYLTDVEHHNAGYWDAYSHTYFDSGNWVQTGIAGLAMNDDKESFKIGTAVYVRQ
jgi:hypothetical protein